MDVAVDASASTDDGTIVTYSWSFGDGGVAAGEKATHTYKLPGIYTITLDLLDNDGLTATLSQDVEIIDYPPVADFTFTVDGATVSFLSASTDDYGIVSYSWDFGDGTTSTEANPTHTYSTEPVPPGLALTEMSGKARTPQMWYGMIGYCFGTSGNPLAGVAVTVTNTITGEWETQVTAADGYYSVDISNNNPNFPTGYAEGDIISVVAVLGSVTDSGSGVVDTNAAVYTWIDFTLDSGPVAHDYMVKLTVTDELGQKSTIGKLVTVYW
jgi:chitodextrinase